MAHCVRIKWLSCCPPELFHFRPFPQQKKKTACCGEVNTSSSWNLLNASSPNLVRSGRNLCGAKICKDKVHWYPLMLCRFLLVAYRFRRMSWCTKFLLKLGNSLTKSAKSGNIWNGTERVTGQCCWIFVAHWLCTVWLQGSSLFERGVLQLFFRVDMFGPDSSFLSTPQSATELSLDVLRRMRCSNASWSGCDPQNWKGSM